MFRHHARHSARNETRRDGNEEKMREKRFRFHSKVIWVGTHKYFNYWRPSNEKLRHSKASTRRVDSVAGNRKHFIWIFLPLTIEWVIWETEKRVDRNQNEKKKCSDKYKKASVKYWFTQSDSLLLHMRVVEPGPWSVIMNIEQQFICLIECRSVHCVCEPGL